MIDQMVYVSWLELVQNRHWYSSVCQSRQEGDTPVSLVARTYRHLVTLDKTAMLIHNMHLGYPARHIPVMQGHALIVRERRPVPVLPEALFIELVHRVKFHNLSV